MSYNCVARRCHCGWLRYCPNLADMSRMSHVTHMYESCHTAAVRGAVATGGQGAVPTQMKWVMLHMWMSHVTQPRTNSADMSHTWTSHATQVQCEGLMLRVVKILGICVKWNDSFIRVTWIIHMCHISYLYVWHVSWVAAGGQDTAPSQLTCHTSEWVTSHIWMVHVNRINESCHTYERVMSQSCGARGCHWEWSRYYANAWAQCTCATSCCSALMNESCRTYKRVKSHSCGARGYHWAWSRYCANSQSRCKWCTRATSWC